MSERRFLFVPRQKIFAAVQDDDPARGAARIAPACMPVGDAAFYGDLEQRLGKVFDFHYGIVFVVYLHDSVPGDLREGDRPECRRSTPADHP